MAARALERANRRHGERWIRDRAGHSRHHEPAHERWFCRLARVAGRRLRPVPAQRERPVRACGRRAFGRCRRQYGRHPALLSSRGELVSPRRAADHRDLRGRRLVVEVDRGRGGEMSATEIWARLRQAGLVQGELPEQEGARSPWFVRAMLGIAGWFGALFLLLFVGFGLSFIIKDSGAALITGV